MSSLVKASMFCKDVDTSYVNSGPVGAGKKTPVDLTENNVCSFLFEAQITSCVDYIVTVLTDLLSALLDWELSVVLTNRLTEAADWT